MSYVEAPAPYPKQPGERAIFLAGGISGCADWQRAVAQLLCDAGLTVYNPRRADFALDDPSAAAVQIRWEHRMLRDADAILFWFPCETLCPITLYELGAWSMSDKPLFVGVHPAYQRRQDVEIQTRLARPDVAVTDSLAALVASIVESEWLRG